MGALLTRSLPPPPPPPTTTTTTSSSSSSSSSSRRLVLPPVSSQIHAAEAQLLRKFTNVEVDKAQICLPSGVRINTLSAGDQSNPALLLLHGWGGGGVFFSKNIDELSRHFRVYLIDWPGFGASSRPPYDRRWDVTTAESFFIDTLYEWIIATNNLGSVHIVAHSLGAYLATAFTLKYPSLVNSLILASPVGVGEPPVPKLPSPLTSFRRFVFLGLVFLAWDYGLFPQSLIRIVPTEWGKRIAASLIVPRMAIHDPSEISAMTDYFYQVSVAPRSAELSACTILESGAYAKSPLCRRLPQVNVPVTFVYGERDWIDVNHGREAAEVMSVPTKVIVAPNAGHHLYFDNAPFFNSVVIEHVKSLK